MTTNTDPKWTASKPGMKDESSIYEEIGKGESHFRNQYLYGSRFTCEVAFQFNGITFWKTPEHSPQSYCILYSSGEKLTGTPSNGVILVFLLV